MEVSCVFYDLFFVLYVGFEIRVRCASLRNPREFRVAEKPERVMRSHKAHKAQGGGYDFCCKLVVRILFLTEGWIDKAIEVEHYTIVPVGVSCIFYNSRLCCALLQTPCALCVGTKPSRLTRTDKAPTAEG